MKILLLHDKIISNFLKRYILSAINSAQVEFASRESALKQLDSEEYDLIVCGNEGYLKPLDLDKKLSLTTRNKDTPLLVITSNSTEVSSLQQRGIEHYALAPFTPESLGLKINEIYLLRNQRKERPRFYIPHSIAVFENEFCTRKVNVININAGGMLCEFSTMPLDFIADLGTVTLQFPDIYSEENICNVGYRFLHFNAMKWSSEQQIAHVKVACSFVNFPLEGEQVLLSVFQKVEQDLYSW